MNITKSAYNSNTSFWVAVGAVLLAIVIGVPMLLNAMFGSDLYSATGIQDSTGQCYDIEGRIPVEYNGNFKEFEAENPEAAEKMKRPAIGCTVVSK